MKSKEIVPMPEAELRRNIVLLGPPPILSTEDAKNFEEFFLKFSACFKVQDMLMLQLVWEYTAHSWFICRYMRHSTVAIERWYGRYREGLLDAAKRRKAQYEKELQAKAQRLSHHPADVAEMAALESKIADTIKDIDDILTREPTELIHNQALQGTAEAQAGFDHLLNSAARRRNNVFDLLERYSRGLGRAVQEAADKVLDAEFEEIEEDQPKIETGVESKEEINARAHH